MPSMKHLVGEAVANASISDAAEARAAREQQRLANEEAERERKQWHQAGIPARLIQLFQKRGLDGLESTEALRRLQAVAATARIVVIAGGVGCGKTTAAAWWLASRAAPRPPAFVQAGPARFVDAPTMATTSRFGDRRGELYAASALVLDDLGAEYMDAKGYFHSELDALVNRRYDDLLPLAITTNLPAAEFLERYGQRVRERIREHGKFIAIQEGSMR